jgi:energy-coupling factor transporter transmembrane protein EcfT
MNKQSSEFKRYMAYRKPKDGRRNGSIAIAFLLAVILLAFAFVLSFYSWSHHRWISAIFDPIIFLIFGIILLVWVYTPESAWPEGVPPRPGPDTLSADELVEVGAHQQYAERYANNRKGLMNLLRWPFFKNRNLGLGNETIIMTVTVVTAAVAIATLLNEFDKLNGPESATPCQCSKQAEARR